MDQQLKSNLTSSKHWIRLVYMLLFAVFLYVASFVVGVLVMVQFIFALITGSDNRKLRELGSSVTLYIQQILLFLTFNSDAKPFPFADWPEPLVAEPEVPETVVIQPAVAPPVVVEHTEPAADDSTDEQGKSPQS
jgi:hypothetical protein